MNFQLKELKLRTFKKVLIFASCETGILSLNLARYSLIPETNISLQIIIIAAITERSCITLFITNNTNAVTTRILSAIGSNNSPNFVCCFKSLAKKPSTKSVKI